MNNMKKILYASSIFVFAIGIVGYAYSGQKHVSDVKSQIIQKNQQIQELTYRMDSMNAFLGQSRPDDTLGYAVNTCYTTSLKTSIASTVTSTISVESSKLCNGEEFTPSYPVYLMINSGGTNSEIIECWGMSTSTSANSFASCNRGLSFSGNNSTSTISANQKAHAGGEKVTQTNVHYTFDQFFDRWASETILGTTSTLQNLRLLGVNGVSFSSTSSYDGLIKNIGGYLGWSEPGSPGSTFLLKNGSSGLTAGKSIDITASKISIGDIVYIPTIHASSTDVDYFTSSTSPNANNTLSMGMWGLGWRNIFSSGTLFGGSVSSTYLEVLGSSTSTFTGTIQSNSAGTSTLPNLWTNQIGPVAGSGTSTIAGNANVNGNLYFTGGITHQYITASDNHIASSSIQISGNNTGSYAVTSKTFRVAVGGSFRIAFDLGALGLSSVSHVKIYKNGVAVGTARDDTATTPATFTNYSEDLYFSQGDIIQLYAYSDASDSTWQIKNFIVYGTITNTINIAE